jgi:hypothetical protein
MEQNSPAENIPGGNNVADNFNKRSGKKTLSAADIKNMQRKTNSRPPRTVTHSGGRA